MITEYPKLSKNQKAYYSSLKERKVRYETGLFIAEGEKIVNELSRSDFNVKAILLNDNPSKHSLQIAERFSSAEINYADSKQFNQICDAVTPQDIVAIVKIPELIPQKGNNFIALDGISDPGNMGTIIRTADWFGFAPIYLSKNCADPFSPKVVRASMGSLFRCNCYMIDNLAGYLAKEMTDYNIYGASLEGVFDIQNISPSRKFGLVFGSESHGISDEVNKVLTQKYKISGRGGAESLNVAVSVGISLNHFAKFIV